MMAMRHGNEAKAHNERATCIYAFKTTSNKQCVPPLAAADAVLQSENAAQNGHLFCELPNVVSSR